MFEGTHVCVLRGFAGMGKTHLRRVIAFRHREGRVAPGYVPDPMPDHLREMLKLRSEPGLRDLVSLHWGEWRLDGHSFVVIPGKAALISPDRPSGSPAPAEARMDGVLVFYEPPHGDPVRYPEEIRRRIQAGAAPIHEIPEPGSGAAQAEAEEPAGIRRSSAGPAAGRRRDAAARSLDGSPSSHAGRRRECGICPPIAS